jgi:acyl-CoA thioesterase
MPHEFFEVTPVGEGRWSASGKDRFAEHKGAQFGGYVMGLLMTAVLNEASRRGEPIAMTCTFLSRVVNAPLTIATKRLRQGSALEFWAAEIVQGESEAPCVQATITLAERPATPRFAWTEMPAAAAPESIARSTQGPPMVVSFDQRPVRGFPPFGKDGVSVNWLREDDGRPVDHARLVMFADMFAPRAFYGTGEIRASSTVSCSIYFYASAAEVAAIGADYVLQQGYGRRGADGVCDLSAALWRRDGLLLATSEQLAWFK